MIIDRSTRHARSVCIRRIRTAADRVITACDVAWNSHFVTTTVVLLSGEQQQFGAVLTASSFRILGVQQLLHTCMILYDGSALFTTDCTWMQRGSKHPQTWYRCVVLLLLNELLSQGSQPVASTAGTEQGTEKRRATSVLYRGSSTAAATAAVNAGRQQ